MSKLSTTVVACAFVCPFRAFNEFDNAADASDACCCCSNGC